MDRSDENMSWNDSEEFGNISSECEEDEGNESEMYTP